VIDLDARFFKMIDDFEERFPKGTPSLRSCDRLAVTGDVTFGADIVFRGEVLIRAESQVSIADASTIEGSLAL
jgi:UTP--glucose-1-phosphate uridylyltransferase